MKNPVTHVKYIPKDRLYEVVIGGVFMVVTEEDIEKSPGSQTVKFIFDKVAEQQK